MLKYVSVLVSSERLKNTLAKADSMLVVEKPDSIMIPSPFRIPPISDELLEELGTKIAPVVERNGKLYYIEAVDPRRTAFTWDPVLAGEAADLEVLVELKTLHSYGAPALFKPSIAEALAQIPVGYTTAAVAFKTTPNAKNVSDWVEAEGKALYYGYHLATTTLYMPI